MTFSACAYALKCLIDPDIPVNDGFYRVITLDAPEGTVTNARWPAAVVGGWETHDRLVEVLFRALLPALPERLPAGTKGMMCHAGFGGLDPRPAPTSASTRRSRAGTAAAPTDGLDAVQAHGQNTENAPIEETELNYPVRIGTVRRCVEDSEGPGRQRGGLGLLQGLRLRPADDVHDPGRPRPLRPPGRRGGDDGEHAEYVLIRDGDETRLGSKSTLELEPGRRDQRPHLRRRRLRPGRGARPGARAARRPRGPGEPRAGA